MQSIALGFNVYLWGEDSQNRFLSECLAPVVEGLHREGVLERFWYDRMGTRGPHLFILIAVQRSLASQVDEQLRSVITGYLNRRPSTEVLTPSEVLRIHEDMRGKVFCQPDTLEILAENNTFHAFQQAEDEYPFFLIDKATPGFELWPCITNLHRWSLSCLQQDAPARSKFAAIFALVFNEVCFQNDAIAVDYWKYHSETLLIGLDRAPLDDKTLAHVLPQLIRTRNLSALKSYGDLLRGDRYQSILKLSNEARESVQTLKRYISVASKQGFQALPVTDKIVVREILHVLLKQFGLSVPQHVPILLFLWLMSSEATQRIEPAAQF